MKISPITGGPSLLKAALYVGEIVILNVLFYFLFSDRLTASVQAFSQISSLYGWMAMSLTMAYCAGVWMCPMTFYYRGSRNGSIFRNVTSSLMVTLLLFLLFVIFVNRLSFFRTWYLPVYFILLHAAFVIWRVSCRSLIQYLRSMGRNVHKVVYVGSDAALYGLYEEMNNPLYGYQVEGYFADDADESAPEGLTWLGPVTQVTTWLKQHQVQQLYCCLPNEKSDVMIQVMDTCEKHCVHFFILPNIGAYLKRQMTLEMLGSYPVLSVREDPLMSLTNRFVKRVFDIVVSSLVMIPFWLLVYPVVALLTKILQPGPVFFRQKRSGLNGKDFMCYKFRSMRVNADADRLQATADDPRKTKFGDFLRRSSIDELPQFINVLRGDMSIVGPRPHMLSHTEAYSALIDKYMVRHWVRPGITGWAQVSGARGETRELWQMEKRVEYDIWYIEHWSLGLDIRIIFMTIWNAIVGDKQAY